MKNIAIIGASYLQLPLIEKAKELGFITHVFAWASNDVGEEAADFFYPISITEIDEIERVCRSINIDGICSIASDLAAVTVNTVASRLGLPGNTLECTKKSTNKHLMRMAFEMNGDPSPRSYIIESFEDAFKYNFSFPVIVKPTDRSGSRGIYLVDSECQLKEAIESAMSESFEKKALIEEYVEGDEYSVEGISYHGKHRILAVTQKYTTGVPHFIETGHYEPAAISERTFESIKKVITHALDSLGISDSASHSEIKIDNNNNIKIIEIGGRMGGDCIGSDLVRYSTGIDFVRAVIQVACGEEPDLKPVSEPLPVEVKFIFNEDDIIQMEECKKTNKFIKLVALYPENIGKTTDSSNRAGCYIKYV